MKIYDKRPLSFLEQVEKLKDKNLIIEDQAKAEDYLNKISYYRLSAYFFPLLYDKGPFR